MDRLVEESHPEGTLSYSYDASGNRQSMTDGIFTSDYAYDDAERMTRAGSETFSYDANGNLTSRTSGSVTTEYSYDSRNHLVKAGEKSYQRDAFGRAVSSTDEGGTKTDYLFDGSEVLRETTAGGEGVNYTRGLADRLISRRQGTSPPSYYHHDPIGSIVGLSDGAGSLTDSYAYDAFGNERSGTGSSTQPYGYAGNRHDPTSKLSDFHARSYDPATGRFTSEDPVAGRMSKAQTSNPYAYGVNGPLAHPDPSGRFVPPCLPECFIAGGLIAGEGAAQLGEYSPSDSPYERSYKNSLTGDNLPSGAEEGGNDYYLNEEDQAEPADAGSGGGDYGGGGGSDDGGSVTGSDGSDDYGDGDDEGSDSGGDDAGDYGDSSDDSTNSGPISMDEAVEQGSDYVGGQGEMQTTPGGNYQFNNEYYDEYGNRINDVARFDVNPADDHVQNSPYGPHLNLETYSNGAKQPGNQHIPIDDSTVRPGDYPPPDEYP